MTHLLLIEVNVAQRKMVKEIIDATKLAEIMRQYERKRQSQQIP